MTSVVTLFWPGDHRARPNETARPSIEAATSQLERALRKLGRASRRIEGFITKPSEAITRLGPVDDPLIGVCVHWFYGPHTTDGVVGKDNPLLLASNFSGQWPGLVGLLNTGACLESLNRPFSRAWTSAEDWTEDEAFMARLDEWCRTGRTVYPESEVTAAAATRDALAAEVLGGIRKRRVLALMLGDTSMGMINGYFGPRLLNPIGFTEHKIDQAWLVDRAPKVDAGRVEDAYRFVCSRGVTFHHGEGEAEDFGPEATKEQLRDYLAVLDLVREYEADCLGWQYQLGLIPLRPPSDFAEGLFNSVCRPEPDGEPIICATEADQGNLVPMELMKRLLKGKGLAPCVHFHDVRWGGEHRGRFVWVLLNSGSCSAYAFSHDVETLRGVHSYRQPAQYFPNAGGTFAGESLPGAVTWARAWLRGRDQRLVMDVGRGEVVKLPEAKRDAWWNGTTRQWPFMACDLGVTQETIMAHHMSNHVAVAYGDIHREMIALSQGLGFEVRVFGK